ncbi:hypothetical protein EAH89_25250 [Roseomonas nepalensis]|uniref:Uncharacterized protein n=1 Tax=Muricoccus nepalensis TaxID=1854500 RepID=A0A502F9K3_9PROT|nr:hypothetical protein [Roseomonas nepalensis]TPG46037.1 hypothetical protein EAH89_25250 [Roseomonas nepalensis]
MSLRLTSDRRFQSELRSVLATLQCLSDYAADRGDAQSAAILGNAAGLMELSLVVPAAQAPVRPPVPTREQLAEAVAGGSPTRRRQRSTVSSLVSTSAAKPSARRNIDGRVTSQAAV